MQCWRLHQDLRFSLFCSISSHFMLSHWSWMLVNHFVKVFVQSWPAMMPWISSPESLTVMVYELFNSEHWPNKWISWSQGCLFAGQFNLNVFPCGQVWTLSPLWWRTRRPSWSSLPMMWIQLRYVCLLGLQWNVVALGTVEFREVVPGNDVWISSPEFSMWI